MCVEYVNENYLMSSFDDISAHTMLALAVMLLNTALPLVFEPDKWV